MGRKLKNYSQYMNKLLDYCALHDYKVYHSEESSNEIVPLKKYINLESGQSESDDISSLLHEIGHLIEMYDYSVTQGRRLDKAYKAAYSDKPMKLTDHLLVLNCETKAWIEGERLAKRLRIPLGKWFYEAKQEAIQSYQELPLRAD